MWSLFLELVALGEFVGFLYAINSYPEETDTLILLAVSCLYMLGQSIKAKVSEIYRKL